MDFKKVEMEDLGETEKDLIDQAISAKNFSYSPYSKFRVGSSLLTKDGKIYTGCNIENISFSPTVCAERTALFKAISEGSNGFEKIVVAVDDNNFCTPCGVCRQVISEFCSVDLEIYLINGKNEIAKVKFGDLFPGIFSPDSQIG